MSKHYTFRLRGFRWLFRRHRFDVYKYTWEDPDGCSPSPEILMRSILIGGITIDVRYAGCYAGYVYQQPHREVTSGWTVEDDVREPALEQADRL